MMAFIRCTLVVVALLWCMIHQGQTVYYPTGASQLLKETAADMAQLLQRATGTAIPIQPYTIRPTTGIVLVYDSTVTGNQTCRIEGNGTSYLLLAAAQDNGLVFGAYHYLYLLGLRFYQPGTAWEWVPSMASPYKALHTTVSGHYKYRNWFISGGHNRWAMDNTTAYNWDVYFGQNGHQWALYQRRNGMAGAHRFAGHRTDILTSGYLTTMQQNPCYVASYNGSRQANLQSVPDINNAQAMQLWGNAIEQKYRQYRNAIYGNPTLYANQYHNFAYNNQLIGLEVPDGAQWGNTTDNTGCNANGYPSASDQQFTLAAKAIANIGTQQPDAAFQCYAYSSHANVPSSGIGISNRLDVQVIPTAFQSEGSAKGLLNRWYNRHGNVSEYHYLNIPQWGGETPMLHKTVLEQTLARLRAKNSQGIVWEASPAKFASLPYLLAANRQLQYGIPVDSTLKEYCNNLFGPAAAPVYNLLQWWGDDRTVTTGDFIPDNRYKLPLYLGLVHQAAQAAQGASPVVQERLAELKAYLHYMVLYYNWLFDQRSHAAKAPQAAALCLYLASVNRLQLVNSYFLIADICSRYATSSAFYKAYNPTDGTAYQQGALPLITRAEIEQNFSTDCARLGNTVQQYQLLDAGVIKTKLAASNISPAARITVKMGYTNGYEYPGQAIYTIEASGAGSITLQYAPRFDMPGKGHINFTVEAADKALEVVADISLANGATAGERTIQLPAAGTYQLSVNTRFKTAVDLTIVTNGNLLYKGTAFWGNKTENYRGNLLSLPGWFYVPSGMERVYFSINNGNPGGMGFAKPEDINRAFVFKDHNGNTVQALLANATDSALYYLPVPAGASGQFWQAVKMEQYNLCFANISNHFWYAARKPCSNATFAASIINRNGNCITALKTASTTVQWEIYDASKWLYYTTSTVELPDYVSPNAIVTLKTGGHCVTVKRLGDDLAYLRQRDACASGAPLPVVDDTQPKLAPNPTTGEVNCLQGSVATRFDELRLLNAQGQPVAVFNNAARFNIAQLAAGLYHYSCTVNGQVYKGKLVKL
jgi:hypothetical protein